MRLRVLVGRLRGLDLAGGEVRVVMALARAVDAVGPMEPGVEPLRAVGRAHLLGEHVAKLVEEGARILLGGEISGLPAPIGPGPGQPVEHLAGVGFADEALILGKRLECPLVGNRPPEPRGNGPFLDLLGDSWHACLPEVFLGKDIGGHLAPMSRHYETLEVEDHRAVWIADLARAFPEGDSVVGRFSRLSKTSFDPHSVFPPAFSPESNL